MPDVGDVRLPLEELRKQQLALNLPIPGPLMQQPVAGGPVAAAGPSMFDAAPVKPALPSVAPAAPAVPAVPPPLVSQPPGAIVPSDTRGFRSDVRLPSPVEPQFPMAERAEALAAQGRPQYHGWAKLGDILAQMHPIGRAIEAGAGIGTIGYRNRLAEARYGAAEERAQAEMEGKKPKDENLSQLYASAVADAISRGVNPNEDPKVLQIADTIQRTQKEAVPSGVKTPFALWLEQNPKGTYGEWQKAQAEGLKPEAPAFTMWTRRFKEEKGREPNAKEIQAFQTAGTQMRIEGLLKMRDYGVFDKGTGQLTMVSADEIAKNPQRYAPAAQAGQALQRTALVNDIRQSALKVKNNLEVLNRRGFDNAALAAALANPETTVGAYIQSLPRGALDDQGQQFVADLFNLREQAMALRTVLGAGQGSEDLRKAILQTLPGVATPSKAFGEKQINNLLGVLARLEKGIPLLGAAGEAARTETGQAEPTAGRGGFTPF